MRKIQAPVQGQIRGQVFAQLGGVQLLHRVVLQKMSLVGEVVEEGTERGDFPGPGGGAEAVLGPDAVLLLGTVPAEIGQISVDVRQGDGADKVDIHVQDGDLVPGRVTERTVPGLLHVAEKISQVQKIFVYGFLRMGLDVFVVR